MLSGVRLNSSTSGSWRAQFLPGMTWQNWGPVWQVDEIIPCEAFDLTVEAEDRLCWHYTNSRPLWSSENQSRGGLWCDEVKQEYRKEIERLLLLPPPDAHSSLLEVKTPAAPPRPPGRRQVNTQNE